jgi:hypothetical protein
VKGSEMDYTLSKGSHETREQGLCAMEWVAYIAGEDHSDAPVCVDPVLRRFGIGLNDRLPDDLRQRLRPYLARMIGTANDGLSQRRAFMVGDWAVRVVAPEAMDAVGRKDLGDRLRGLPEVVDVATRGLAVKVAREVRGEMRAYAADAYAAYAAYAYAYAAAAHAAHAAAHAAADAAADAAAAYAAAGRAMWEKLLPTALDLLDRMLPTEPITVPALPSVAEELCRA